MEIGGERIFLSPKLGDMEVEDTTGNPRWGVYQLAFTVEDLDRRGRKAPSERGRT